MPMQKIITLFVCLIFSAGGYSAMLPDMASLSGHNAGFSGWDLSATATGDDLPGNKSELSLRVFPNPATDFIRIEWPVVPDMEIHAEIYDLFGRRLIQAKAEESDNHIRIDIQSLQTSAYLLKIFTPDGKFSKTYRVVKH
jgi:hypothetical protein